MARKRREDEPLTDAERTADQQANIDQTFQDLTGGTESQAAGFLNDNPGDVDRLYSGTVFTNTPGPQPQNEPPSPPPPPPPPPPGPTRPAAPSGGGGGGGGGWDSRVFPGYGVQAFAPPERYSSPMLDKLLQQMIENQTRLAQQRAAQEEENRVFRGKVRGNVLNTIERASKMPTLSDPTLYPQVQAYAGAQGRARQQGQERIAARRAAKGISQGGADAAIEGGFERMGQATGEFNAGLLRDALSANRAELMNAMQLGAGILSGDEERDLREQLASLDTELGRLGLQTGAFTTTRGQDLSGMLGMQNIGLQNRGLDLQNQQFYDRMGYDASIQEAMLNQALIQQLLGQSA